MRQERQNKVLTVNEKNMNQTVLAFILKGLWTILDRISKSFSGLAYLLLLPQ